MNEQFYVSHTGMDQCVHAMLTYRVEYLRSCCMTGLSHFTCHSCHHNIRSHSGRKCTFGPGDYAFAPWTMVPKSFLADVVELMDEVKGIW